VEEGALRKMHVEMEEGYWKGLMEKFRIEKARKGQQRQEKRQGKVEQKRQRQAEGDSRKGTVPKVRKRPGVQRGEGQELGWRRNRVDEADRQEQREEIEMVEQEKKDGKKEQREGVEIVSQEKEEGKKRDGGGREDQTVKKGQLGLLKSLAREWLAQRQEKERELKKRGPVAQEEERMKKARPRTEGATE